MKFCKSCAFFQSPKATLDVGEYAKCTKGMVVNPVTGETDLKTQSSNFCITLRQSDKPTDCGRDAKFYLALEVPFVERIFS
jgi:hypothetical protein